MDHLNGIVFFVRAAEAGSFAGAAKTLAVTPSAVSKAVSRLEARLGLQLFRRSTRSIDLTEDGRAFFERCQYALAEIDAAENFLLHRRSTPRGRLRVSMLVTFGYRLVAPLLPAFRQRYPEVTVETVSSDGVADLVDDGFDVVIRSGQIPDTNIVARKLIDTRFMTCASPDYLAAHGRPRTLNDLERHACTAYVFPSSGRVFSWPLQHQGKPVTFIPNAPLTFSNADAMIRACEAGAGLVHLQDYMLQDSVAAGRLKPVLERYAANGGPVSAVYLPSRHLSPKVRAFVDFLRSEIPQLLAERKANK